MVVGVILTAAIPAVATTIIQTLVTPKVRSPKVAPGDILRQALDIVAIQEQGNTPVLTIDPFTGDRVLSTADQAPILFDLLGERFARETLRGTPEESAAIFQEREAFIDSRRQLPVAAEPVNTVRETVVQALSTTTAKNVSPGIVDRKTSSLARSRRLGGPCAAANTGFSRLNCARGGFA